MDTPRSALDRRYEQHANARMLPQLRVGLYAGSLLFLAYGAWDLVLGGRAELAANLPYRLGFCAALAILAILTQVSRPALSPVAIFHSAAFVTAVGCTLLSCRLPEGRVFETGALLLLALVLAAVAPTLRDALLSSLTLAGCAALVPVVAGPGLVPVVTTEFFLVPGLAIACLLVRLREQADRSAWALRHELEAERERLAHLACTDALTGVHNRRSFMDRLAAAASLGARHGRPVSVLLLDVDHFKAINDTHGHPVGDSTLRALAATCLRSLRDGDCVGRLGGEEFAVLLPETDGAGAVVIGERLRAALARTEVPASGVRLRFTVSVGVASLDAAADDAEKLLHRADEALYAAKRGGRNRVKAA